MALLALGDSSTEHCLFQRFAFFTARLPDALCRDAQARFQELWQLHPSDFHQMRQPGTANMIPVPRWQQAYGRDYAYSGNVNRALPIPAILEPLLDWARTVCDARLNGLLLNWYDAERAHRIGAHRDSIVGLVEGSPIVTISLGATRIFRLWPAGGPRVSWTSKPPTAPSSCSPGRRTGASSTACPTGRAIPGAAFLSRCAPSFEDRRRSAGGTEVSVQSFASWVAGRRALVLSLGRINLMHG